MPGTVKSSSVTTPYTLRHFKIAVAAFFAALGLGTLAFWATVHEDAFVLLPLHGDDLIDRPRQPSRHGGRRGRHDPGHPRGHGNLRVHRRRARRDRRPGRAHGSVERSEEATCDRPAERPLHHLRLRSRGPAVASEFRTAGVPCVVLDVDPKAIATAQERGELWIEGSATSDEDPGSGRHRTRARARRIGGLGRGQPLHHDLGPGDAARTCSSSPGRPIPRHTAKLLRAGADRVTQPFATAGSTMAKLVLRPQVAAFLDSVTTEAGAGSRIEEIEVTVTCAEAGKRSESSGCGSQTGALIVACEEGRDIRHDAEPRRSLDVGDVIIAVGTRRGAAALEEHFAPARPLPAEPSPARGSS